MDRTAIKKKAFNIVLDNFFVCWKALIVNVFILVIQVVLFNFLLKGLNDTLSHVFYYIYSFITIPISFGITKYLLNLIYNKNPKFSDVFYYYRHQIVSVVILSCILNMLFNVGLLLYIIPAVIIYLMFSMSQNIIIEKKTNPIEALKMSMELIKGYKWDYLNFLIGFLGWIVLCFFTLGAAFIFVLPYISIAQNLYYIELKKIKKVKY